MPKLTQLKASLLLRHIFIRGIERRRIFRNNKDRKFWEGFGDVVIYVALLFHHVPSTIFSIALVILEVATRR